MSSTRGLDGVRALGLLALSGVLVLAGCGRESAQHQLDTALAKAGVQKQNVYPLAGRITIDGAPPQVDKKTRLVVMLYDPSKADLQPGMRPHVDVAPDGTFAFSTYTTADGLPAGKYILLFAQFTHNKKRGYEGPDQLKNLYNDPEKNGNIKEFNIDHLSPGRKDLEFDLKIAGVDPATPVPKSVTKIPEL